MMSRSTGAGAESSAEMWGSRSEVFRRAKVALGKEVSERLTSLTTRLLHSTSSISTMPELIDDHVSVKQCRHAVTALMEYVLKEKQKREENELLPGKEENIWLQIAVKEVHAEAKLKPHRMCVELDFLVFELTLWIALSNILLLTLVHLLSALLRRIPNENTRIS
jgi:hypothetical protein